MANTQEILKAAQDLGKLIAAHDASRKFEAALGKLQGDREAQRVLNDYNNQATKLAEKEEKGQPVEVEDKRQLQQLHNGVIRNATLRDFQMAQMDYLDLMRKVDEAMTGAPGNPGNPGNPAAPAPAGRGEQTQAPAASPIINPQVIGKIRRDQ